MTLLARFKGWLARRRCVGEFCHDCGRRVRLVWSTSDALWRLLVPDQGPRCIRCFDRRARRARVLLRWTAEVCR